MKKMFSSLALVVLMSAGVSAQNIPMDASVKPVRFLME